MVNHEVVSKRLKMGQARDGQLNTREYKHILEANSSTPYNNKLCCSFCGFGFAKVTGDGADDQNYEACSVCTSYGASISRYARVLCTPDMIGERGREALCCSPFLADILTFPRSVARKIVVPAGATGGQKRERHGREACPTSGSTVNVRRSQCFNLP